MQRTRRATSGRVARPEIAVTTAALLDLRDDLASATNLVDAVYLASLGLQTGERAALCAVSDAARDKLVGIAATLDAMLGKATPHRAA